MNIKSRLLIKISWVIFFLITCFAATSIRLYPLSTQDKSLQQDRASLYVITKLKNQISQNVQQAHPQLSRHNQEVLVDKLLNETLLNESNQLRNTIEKVAQRLADNQSTQDESIFLLASDSYYYFDLTKNVLENGKLSEHVRGSKYLNEKMLSPTGHWEPYNLHPYVGAQIYYIWKHFNHELPLLRALSITPLILTIIAVLFFYTACFQLGLNVISTFCGSLFFVWAPIFVKRSSYGWYDNDPYNTIFPLLILTLIFYVFRHFQKKEKVILGALSCGAAITLYAHFWQGWMLFFFLLMGAVFLIALHAVFLSKQAHLSESSKKLLILLPTTTIILISVFFGFNEFFILIKEGWIALTNFLKPQLSIWPDLYISVGELHRSDFTELTRALGGKTYVYLAFIGLVLSIFISFTKRETFKLYQLCTLLVMTCGTIFLAFGAQRFSLLVLPGTALLFPILLQSLFDIVKINSIKQTHTERTTVYLHCLLSVIFISTLFLPYQNIQKRMPHLLNPIYNATWQKALTQIKDHTPSDSIITTWWPPGHFIKAIAERRVTFDGATINYPQAYWVSNIFLSRDERQAAGILRMLNVSGNKSAEFLVKNGFTVSEAVEILRSIVSINRDQASNELAKTTLNVNQIEELLTLTHAESDPAYLLLYNEFVENNLQLAFFGKWNFKRIETINQHPELLKQVPNPSSSEYVSFLWGLVGGPYRYSGPLSSVSRVDNIVLFKENVTINLHTKETKVGSRKYGTGIPYSIFYIENETFHEKVFDNANLGYSVALIERNDNLQVLLLDRVLAESMLIRLYYFNAVGLKFFKPTFTDSDLTGRTAIKTFQASVNDVF